MRDANQESANDRLYRGVEREEKKNARACMYK